MFASKDLFFSKPSGYQISRSVRLRSSASAYFNRTPASATNQKTLTWSSWVKRGAVGADATILGTADSTGAGYNLSIFRFTSTDILRFVTTNNVGASVLQFDTTAVFRDPSAWYHVVLYIDTTQATNTNGIRIYVNGVNQTGTYAAYTQNTNTFYNSTIAQYIGRWGSISPTNYFDGYLTEVNFIDGQALTPSSFGQTNTITGVWQPLKYTGTYGTNGFYLNFSDNSNNTSTTIGKDYSGNGNNWTPNNISVTAGVTYDSMLDVPTLYADGGNGRGNYATLNPLPNFAATSLSITNGNLNWTSNQGVTISTIGFISDKFYCEVTPTTASSSLLFECGVVNIAGVFAVGYRNSGTKDVDSNSTNSAYGSTYTVNDVIGIACDATAKTITFYKNNVSQGAVSYTLTGDLFFSTQDRGVSNSAGYINFGQRPFTYTPPTGFVALNTQNKSAGTITTSGTFTGNASTDGPFIYLNGVPTTMTINGNAVTFGTNADHLANGFKVRSASASYNASGSNTYSVTVTGANFKYANAQTNP